MSLFVVDSSFFIDLINSTSYDRLKFIEKNNPEWALKIQQFITRFPEFNRYRNIASATDRPSVQNNENWMPISLFEHVIYYVCCSGVRYSYAIKQFSTIIDFLRSNTWQSMNEGLYNFIVKNNIQNKKREIYWNIFSWMIKYGITNSTLTIDHITYMKNEINGLGDGFLGYMNENFSKNDDCIQYTDTNFINGFYKVYGRNDSSFIKQKCLQYSQSGFGRVANTFMFQIFYYGN